MALKATENAMNAADAAAAAEKAAAALAIIEAKAARSAELKAKRDDERAKREGESKADAFKRIGARRVNNVLGEMNTLAGLANKANYEYTPEQAQAVINAITAKLAEVKAAFDGEAKAKGGFAF